MSPPTCKRGRRVVSAGYMRAVRDTSAHLESSTRGISALRTWGTQDFNLTMLAIQQGGPRRRISYPRPLECSVRGAWRPRFRGPTDGPDITAMPQTAPRSVFQRLPGAQWQPMSYMRHSRWILSSRCESRRGLRTGLVAEGARWQFAYFNSAHRITANEWINQGRVQVYEEEPCHAHKRAMWRSRRWCVWSLTW
jgi:hypothetical protein